MKHKWLIAMILANALGAGLIVTGACLPLPPEQRAALAELRGQGQNIGLMLAAVDEDIAQIHALIDAKKISLSDGKSILESLLSKKRLIQEKSTEIAAAIKKAKASGLPWWAYVVAGLQITGTLAGSVLGTSKYGGLLKAFGVVSRVADTVGGENTGPAVAAEIKDTPGLTEARMKELHAAAREKNI